MIRTKNIDTQDIHKLVQITLPLGNMTDTVEAEVSRYQLPEDAILTGAQLYVKSAGNADNTVRIRIFNGATVLLDTGSLVLSGAPIDNRTLATGASASPVPDSQVAILKQNLAGQQLTVKDTVAGTTPAANGAYLILELEGTH